MTKWHQEKKYICGNNISFFNKELSSAHKKRTRLRNRYLRKRSYKNERLYTKQRNFCVSLLQKTKEKHYVNLNHKDIADNKSNEKITLVEDNKIIREDEDNADLINSFFSNAVKNLKIREFSDSNPLAENIPHPIFKAILNNKNQVSLPLKTQEVDQVFIFVE